MPFLNLSNQEVAATLTLSLPASKAQKMAVVGIQNMNSKEHSEVNVPTKLVAHY